jgi:proteasome lid subunit RPN8/RPN11
MLYRSSPALIEIAARHYLELRQAFERAYPRECCGLLLGRQGVVKRVVETINAVSLLEEFVIPDREVWRARQIAAQDGLKILAVFHSHPEGSVELSENDRKALACSEWPWVVLTADRAGGLRLTCYKRV